MIDYNQGIKEMDLSRHEWFIQNRLKTNHGRCADMMYRWKLRDSPECDCGAVNQTINHITTECQIRKFRQGIEEIHEMVMKAIVLINNLDV